MSQIIKITARTKHHLLLVVNIENMNKQKLKVALLDATGCRIQHTGWTCGTCFFSINEKLNNKDWQTVLFVRGDYKKEDLDNLPKDIEKQVARILKIISKN